MPGLVDADGKPIAEHEEHAAWAAGTAHVMPGTKVYLRDTFGTLRAVPAEDAAKARSQGMVPVPAKELEQHLLQKEHGGIGAQIGTAAESAADMATVGGYGYAAGKLSPEYAKNLLARREANPTAHIAGSVLGLAPSLAAGGEGAIAEGAELLGGGAEAAGAVHAAEGAGVAADVAKGAEAAATVAGATDAGGGVGNAIRSVANVVGAPIRGVGAAGGVVERGINAGLAKLGYEGTSLAGRVGAKALASGGAGAVEGGLFGVGSALSESSLEGKDLTSEALVSSIGRNALFGGALGAGLAGAAELGGAGVKALTPSAEKLEKFGREQGMRAIGANGKDLQKLGGKLDMTADELMSYEFKTGPDAGKRMFSAASNAKEMAQNLAHAAQETGAAKGGIVDEIDNAIRSNPEVAAVAQPDVGEFFSRVDQQVIQKLRASDSPTIARMANKVERELAPLKASWEASRAYAAEAAAGGVVGAPPEPITFGRLEEFKQSLGKVIYGDGVKGAGIQVAPKAAKQLDRVRGILADFQDESAQKALAAMGEDPSTYATLNRQYSTLNNLKKIADRTEGRMNANRMASPTDHALGMGGMLLSMLSGNVGALGAMAVGGASALANKFLRERGNSILADIAYRTSKMDHLLENTAHALAVSPERLAQPIEAAAEIGEHQAREHLAESKYEPLGIKALGKDFEETSERVRKLADPKEQQAQLVHATGDISNHFPEQGAAMQQKLLQIIGHLNDSLPATSQGNQLTPLASKPRVSPREQQRFLTRVNAALDPKQVLADIAAGKLDKDAVQTLKLVYPATFGALQQKVERRTATNKSEMPYQRVIYISRMFEFDGDSSLGPRLIGIQQTIQTINTPAPPGTPPGAPGRTKQGNPGVSRLGKSFSLPGESAPGEH